LSKRKVPLNTHVPLGAVADVQTRYRSITKATDARADVIIPSGLVLTPYAEI